jgi:hypothetical protein
MKLNSKNTKQVNSNHNTSDLYFGVAWMDSQLRYQLFWQVFWALPQPLQMNARIVSQIRIWRFLPHPLYYSVTQPITWYYMVWNTLSIIKRTINKYNSETHSSNLSKTWLTWIQYNPLIQNLAASIMLREKVPSLRSKKPLKSVRFQQDDMATRISRKCGNQQDIQVTKLHYVKLFKTKQC